MTSIFSKIIRGEINAHRYFENERIIAIQDLYPAAPVHILIIPKKEIRDLQSVSPEDLPLIGRWAVIYNQFVTVLYLKQ